MLEQNNNEKQRIRRDELVTIGDLELFKQELVSALKQLLNNGQGTQIKPWLRSSEVRKMLSISHGTLQTLRINGTIPFTKIGGIVFYRYDDIVELLNSQRCK
ncbi:helix-turn-helix domain-containing protein [Pseudochryseolinea flava]|uniref:DNA-binding protein n=1 Tax=Pseudochryseolinea flava TaxID=2059302 RepID=A0A364Y327_9BACT|nr:helix-turn-helix domain-containing protein [Pseudochryseolinea flava]RAW01099.1 DNA-binding protein [Pseudochryseolinea flava]